MSHTLTILNKETPEYIKRYLSKLALNIDAINNIYEIYKVMLVDIETNIKLEDTTDAPKYTRLLKIVKNILNRGYIYNLQLVSQDSKNDIIITIKSYFKPINKSYLLVFTQNISINRAKITMNEIDETDFSPLYPQVYQLGYSIFKADTKEDLCSSINLDSLLWLKKDFNFEVYLYTMCFSSILRKEIDGSLKEYHKNIDLDKDNKISINMSIKDSFKDLNDKIYNSSNKYLVLFKKIRENFTIIALLIEINSKYYYFSYSFKEKSKHNYAELQTICMRTQKYKLYELNSLEEMGFFRTKSFYKYLNNNIEDTSLFLNIIYFDLVKTLDIMEHFKIAGVEEDDDLSD